MLLLEKALTHTTCSWAVRCLRRSPGGGSTQRVLQAQHLAASLGIMYKKNTPCFCLPVTPSPWPDNWLPRNKLHKPPPTPSYLMAVLCITNYCPEDALIPPLEAIFSVMQQQPLCKGPMVQALASV
jgi:hypothetical protein